MTITYIDDDCVLFDANKWLDQYCDEYLQPIKIHKNIKIPYFSTKTGKKVKYGPMTKIKYYIFNCLNNILAKLKESNNIIVKKPLYSQHFYSKNQNFFDKNAFINNQNTPIIFKIDNNDILFPPFSCFIKCDIMKFNWNVSLFILF